jgi:thiol:disulfide interchange protein DsbC
MKKILFLVLTILFLLSVCYSYGYCEQGKEGSELLGIDEALTILKGFDPNIKVLAVKPSPVEGLWEVDIEVGGKKGLVYVDATREYLISGSIIDIKGKKDLTQERLSEINKVDVSQIPLDDAIVIGNKEASYRVIVFDDPE